MHLKPVAVIVLKINILYMDIAIGEQASTTNSFKDLGCISIKLDKYLTLFTFQNLPYLCEHKYNTCYEGSCFNG